MVLEKGSEQFDDDLRTHPRSCPKHRKLDGDLSPGLSRRLSRSLSPISASPFGHRITGEDISRRCARSLSSVHIIPIDCWKGPGKPSDPTFRPPFQRVAHEYSPSLPLSWCEDNRLNCFFICPNSPDPDRFSGPMILLVSTVMSGSFLFCTVLQLMIVSKSLSLVSFLNSRAARGVRGASEYSCSRIMWGGFSCAKRRSLTTLLLNNGHHTEFSERSSKHMLSTVILSVSVLSACLESLESVMGFVVRIFCRWTIVLVSCSIFFEFFFSSVGLESFSGLFGLVDSRWALHISQQVRAGLLVKVHTEQDQGSCDLAAAGADFAGVSDPFFFGSSF
mmetsp:Transcript_15746/g.24914  ORF Transcript_15746/g.24914 Transcript_15746/m.24914 type:complete len:334 (-) Transcript_15746:4151-5152(-)